ncbi:MAG: hypothetical protein COY66_01535 [Candidatus Kerfeldbacteria bacterium CG_4_10_14_0_8_um_filter_42_10]|uniref:Uncharacterized protein n=1 Tax=Candidatus Kerfeldbacteria bacterium CG_4_10_14_0_8_um_filter_42_10 TaxID=2014248 RepID=A0A2M7RJZ4_9BACT|nr:MAG: hypothetical protein COY66_01535 [Candidatus Kerfeldbacteria bacterium CG_4_10_14_0_8_um_filter_42_10]
MDAIQIQLGNFRGNEANLEKLCQEATNILRSLAKYSSSVEVVISTPLSKVDPCPALIEVVFANPYGRKVLPRNREYELYPQGKPRWFLEKYKNGSGYEWRFLGTYHNWIERYRNIGWCELVITEKQVQAPYPSDIDWLFGKGGDGGILFHRSSKNH